MLAILSLLTHTAAAQYSRSFGYPLPVATLEASVLPKVVETQRGLPLEHLLSSNTSAAFQAQEQPSGVKRHEHYNPTTQSNQKSPLFDQTNTTSNPLRRNDNDPNFRGTLQFDCLEAPEACQNACYYQNCIRGAAGSNSVVQYHDGGGDETEADVNRVNSGVTVNRGTPCKTWPFGQKFWDPFIFNPQGKGSELYLETDEFPMAALQNAAFSPNAAQPQHTLRCITGKSNNAGGRMLSNFRQGKARYKTVWKHHRRGNEGAFSEQAGQNWFYINFNMDSFDDANPVHQNIKQSLTYCFAPFNNCQNDGRQFHMTKLVQTGNQRSSAGKLEWPYDATRQNAYRLDGETANVEQFHIDLNITGESWEKVSVNIFVHRNGGKVRLSGTSQPEDFYSAQSINFRGGLPRSLTITRLARSCDSVGFYYGDPFADGRSWFWFTSEDEGIGDWAYTKGGRNSRARYCQQSDLTDEQQAIIGRRMLCSFPGW